MRYTLLYIVLTACLLTVTACRQRPLYYHYEHTPAEGWSRTDTLQFTTPAVTADGRYWLHIGLCTDHEYPYRNLSLIVTYRILPSGQSYSQTLNSKIIDETGRPLGVGTSMYQFLFPLTNLQLRKGQSIEARVFLNMRCELLPGITSVGLQLNRD